MRIAVISDIHGNYEAFKEVLRDIDHSDINRIVNLGDSIGYGPYPEEVLNLIEKRGIVNILGNHEQAVLDKARRQYFNQSACKSIEHTVLFMTGGSISYIQTLPEMRILNGALFVHGCPPDSPTIYLNHLAPSEIEDVFSSYPNKISFVGHTHRLMLISYDGETVGFHPLKEETRVLDPTLSYIVNVGSVGQPRDNDSRAGYVIWDNEQNNLEVKRIPYDIASTAGKIIERGFQKYDAERLFFQSPKPNQGKILRRSR